MFAHVAAGLTLEIDLPSQTVVAGELSYRFAIDPALKEKMLKGMDDVAMTLSEQEKIRVFEQGHRQRQPWLFN